VIEKYEGGKRMRKANKAVLLLLVALLCVGVVPVQTIGQTTSHQDGNDLLPRCQQAVEAIDRATWKDVNESFNAGFCLGLVQGVSYASADVCTGQGVTFSQMERVVVKFLQDNPKKLNLNQSTLVEMALSKAFPCLKKK
jgi:Rap1a immunity proteins